jgi:hypothetical protein
LNFTQEGLMANIDDVSLGDEVKDTITGFSGVAMAITNWLNLCQRITIAPRKLHDGRPVDMETFDVQQIEVTKAAPVVAATPSGGPRPGPQRHHDPR